MSGVLGHVILHLPLADGKPPLQASRRSGLLYVRSSARAWIAPTPDYMRPPTGAHLSRMPKYRLLQQMPGE